jgi:hypothetical protein
MSPQLATEIWALSAPRQQGFQSRRECYWIVDVHEQKVLQVGRDDFGDSADI